ncbi:uncharacterized protein G2W53_029529 [Senna tora]|uniref:Uncharacterized protein n=1 Tax=Senna tora TaxID=362788 RepID=A0A834T4U9_9FABA|nr:uncharacterized protein G2W53_029529 [Senna tora]
MPSKDEGGSNFQVISSNLHVLHGAQQQ